MDHTTIRDYLIALQGRMVKALADVDGQDFLTDRWERPESPNNPGIYGHGISRILENGACFERGGVNFSHVHGAKLPPSASAQRPELSGCAFEAMGISLVIHPRNPYCPTVHLNLRYFLAKPQDPEKPTIWWFGGGMDLTPYYGFLEDVIHFHQICKTALDPFGSHLYPRFKDWCDQYFYLKHRQEPRGVGGIFFDDLQEPASDGDLLQHNFALIQSVGDHFLNAYLPIIQKRRDIPYGERERNFQAYRRGRYVEFNLIWDRGTLFGLQSNGRTEAILMSMPPSAQWAYQWQPELGSPEAQLYQEFLVQKDWLSS